MKIVKWRDAQKRSSFCSSPLQWGYTSTPASLHHRSTMEIPFFSWLELQKSGIIWQRAEGFNFPPGPLDVGIQLKRNYPDNKVGYGETVGCLNMAGLYFSQRNRRSETEVRTTQTLENWMSFSSSSFIFFICLSSLSLPSFSLTNLIR